jgi:hypothetical protein
VVAILLAITIPIYLPWVMEFIGDIIVTILTEQAHHLFHKQAQERREYQWDTVTLNFAQVV